MLLLASLLQQMLPTFSIRTFALHALVYIPWEASFPSFP